MMLIVAFDKDKNRYFASIRLFEFPRRGYENGFRKTISETMCELTKLFNREYRENAQGDDGVFFKIMFNGYYKLDDFVLECKKYEKEEEG